MVRPKQTLNRRRRREIPLLRGKARKTISRRQKRVTSRNPMKKRTHRISRGGAGSALAPEPAPPPPPPPAAPASARKPVRPLANLPRMAPRMVQHLKNHSKSIADYEKKMTELTTHTKLLEVENADLKRARKELEDAYLKMEDERNALGLVLQGANQNLIKKNFMISRLAQQKMFFAQALNEALNDKSETEESPTYSVRELYRLLSLTESELQNIPEQTESVLESLQTHQATLCEENIEECNEEEKEEVQRQAGCCGWFSLGTPRVFQRICNLLGREEQAHEENKFLLEK